MTELSKKKLTEKNFSASNRSKFKKKGRGGMKGRGCEGNERLKVREMSGEREGGDAAGLLFTPA